MDKTTLVLTIGIEIGLAVGYGLCFSRDWIRDCRLMVLAGVAALSGGKTQ